MKRKISAITSAITLSGIFLFICPVVNGQVKPTSTLKRNAQTKHFETKAKGRDSVDKKRTHCRIQPRVAKVEITRFGLLASTDVIYPGAIIKGNSIENGSYMEVTHERNPLTIHCSELPFANPQDAKVLIENPVPSNVTVGLRTMLSKPLQEGSNQPMQGDIEVLQMYSTEEMKMSLNVQTEAFSAFDISNKFSYDQDEKTVNLTVIYQQVYFTVKTDPPTRQRSYLKDSQIVIKDDWVYVSSVSYGRRGVLQLKLHNLERTMIDSLKAEFGKVKKIKVEANAFWARYSSNIAVNGFIYGGNPDGSTEPFEGSDPKTVLKKFFNYIEEGEKYNMESPGLPIFYELKFLNNRAAAGVYQVLEHNVRTCKRMFKYIVTLKEFRTEATDDGGNNTEELCGQVGMVFKRRSDDDVEIKPYNYATTAPYTGGLKPSSSINGNILFRRTTDDGPILLDDITKRNHRINQVIEFEFNPDDEPAEIILHGDMWEVDGVGDPNEHLIRSLHEPANEKIINIGNLDPDKPDKSKITRELVFETVNPGSKHFAVITIEVKRL